MATHFRSMDDLSDEIIMLIIGQLADPSSFSMTSKRLRRIAGDPYVRSSYFLTRHGPQQAFYWALGRGKLLNERVLDILLSSGAHLSRYLFQTAIHHYFRTTAHFIKHPWARTLPLPVFTHFMHLGTLKFGDVPLSKGEDDGAVFLGWLKDRISPGFGRKIDKEVIEGLFENYGFMVFAPKDPIAVQLPLAFALEPSLLPLAVANGFHMESKSKYRDFIFRKMFEKQNREGRVAEIMNHVREMSSLDSSMFLSRTVAAEVCMECRTNEAGYLALKRLDLAGDLLFELKDLVHDLLKLFLKTRSIINTNTVLTLQTLYRDFPSPSYCSTPARLVMLLTVFCTSPASGTLYVDVATLPAKLTSTVIKAKLEHLGVLPLSRSDLVDVLVSPWCERPPPVLAWAKEQMDMDELEMQALAEDVAVRSLGMSCKGKLIRRLADTYPTVRTHIASAMKLYRIDISSLPDYWADEDCEHFRTRLNATFGSSGEIYPSWAGDHSEDDNEGYSDDGLGPFDNVETDGEEAGDEDILEEERITKMELGLITQDTLTSRIQVDKDNGLRQRRRYWHSRYPNQSDMQFKLPYPCDAFPVGRWVLDAFGPRSAVTAVFMSHAIANRNSSIIGYYLDDEVPRAQHVPVTLTHFKIMARLGCEPWWLLWREIEHVEFYFSENDYLDSGHRSTGAISPTPPRSPHGMPSTKIEVKTPELETKVSVTASASTFLPPDQYNPRKRPRRSAATAPSYIVPGSDDETIAEDNMGYDYMSDRKGKGKAKAESSLQTWIKHLTELLKEEERKYKEKKKTIEKKENGKPKYRLPKSEFMKSLAARLRDMRTTERQSRNKDAFYRRGRVIVDLDSEYDSMGESDGDEYVLHQRKAKKRRAEVSHMDED